jgi:hypothetical protein
MLTSYRTISPARRAENLEIARTAQQLARDADKDQNNEEADRLLEEVRALGDLRTVDRRTYDKALKLLDRSLRLRRG